MAISLQETIFPIPPLASANMTYSEQPMSVVQKILELGGTAKRYDPTSRHVKCCYAHFTDETVSF